MSKTGDPRGSRIGRWVVVVASLAGIGLATLPLAANRPEAPILAKEDWRVLAPIQHEQLAIFPIVLAPGSTIPDPQGYITLDEGLKSGTVEVREVGGTSPPMIRNRPPGRGGPSAQNPPVQEAQRGQSFEGGAEVNRLLVFNRSGKTLILLAGELVVGGKQDRIVQKDTLVPSSPKPFDLSVFCVEQGRWRGNVAGFKAAANASVAGGKGAVADPSVRGAAQAERTQSAVWDRVAEKNLRSGAAPGAGTYQATVAHPKLQKDSKTFVDAIQLGFPKSGAVGAVIAIRGRVVWVDAFSSPEMFAKYWPKLLHSYVVDALTTSMPSYPQGAGPNLTPIASVAEATGFLRDRNGKTTFEGTEGVCRLTRTESPEHLIFELRDLGHKGEPLVHFNKMRKR